MGEDKNSNKSEIIDYHFEKIREQLDDITDISRDLASMTNELSVALSSLFYHLHMLKKTLEGKEMV